MVEHRYSEGSTREAEKAHVSRMGNTDGLMSKPFLSGGSLSVEIAQVEIAIFSAMVGCLPVGPGSLVLDLGSGPCWVSDWLRKLKYRTCSMDICFDMLRFGLRRMGPGSWACVADMAAIPLSDNSVDAVVCHAALHHVPDWRSAIAEVYRVLRPGGVFVVQEPGRGHSKQSESIAQMDQFGVLEQDMPPGLLVKACRAAGFSRAIVRPVAELSHGLIRVLPPYAFFRDAPRLFIHKNIRRLLVSIVERLLNLWAPIHLVVAMKGTPYVDSSRPDVMVARFRSIDFRTELNPACPTPIRVSVHNTGLTRWLAEACDDSGLGRVRLGVSRLDENRKIVDLDFLRLSLPHDVNPGETVELSGEVPPLAMTGRAVIRLDMVSEGVCWFSDKGSRPVYLDVQVREQAGDGGCVCR